MIEKIVREIMLKSGETVTITFGLEKNWGPWKAQCGTATIWAPDLETTLLRLLANCPKAEQGTVVRLP